MNLVTLLPTKLNSRASELLFTGPQVIANCISNFPQDLVGTSPYCDEELECGQFHLVANDDSPRQRELHGALVVKFLRYFVVKKLVNVRLVEIEPKGNTK